MDQNIVWYVCGWFKYAIELLLAEGDILWFCCWWVNIIYTTADVGFKIFYNTVPLSWEYFIILLLVDEKLAGAVCARTNSIRGGQVWPTSITLLSFIIIFQYIPSTSITLKLSFYDISIYSVKSFIITFEHFNYILRCTQHPSLSSYLFMIFQYIQ